MPSSSVRSFTDSDAYAAAIRATKAELTVTTRGQFAAKLTRIDLHHLWMQRFSESVSRVVHSAGTPGRAGITFRTLPGPGLSWGRAEMLPSTVVQHGDGHDAFQRSSGPVSFGAMSLPPEALASAAAAIAGCDLAAPGDELGVTARPSAMARLLRLHAAAGHLAESAPEIIAHAEAARGLEQVLVEAMVACISKAEPEEDSSALRRHATVMRRFHAAISEHPLDAIYIPDICAQVGVSQRTLNLCCQQSLGVGPKRYLLLRRMNLARQALRRGDAVSTTVSGVAADLGFWNFGRFAVEYRTMFGETPSATLQGPPD